MDNERIIEEIIEEAFAKKTEENQERRISDRYVIEVLKKRIHPTLVFNHCKRQTSDGVKNLHNGAKQILQKAKLYLAEKYNFEKNEIRENGAK